jgi:hypothetical protein
VEALAEIAIVRAVTSIPIVTRIGIGGIDAADGVVAGIVRANVAIIAVGRRSTSAVSAAAGICGSTGESVVTGARVVRVDATDRGIARVVGAGVAIVAVQEGSAAAVRGTAAGAVTNRTNGATVGVDAGCPRG